MPHRFTCMVVVANARLGGRVIYLTADDAWTDDLREAEIIEDEAHAVVRLLDGASQRGTADEVRLADIRPGPNGPELADPASV